MMLNTKQINTYLSEMEISHLNNLELLEITTSDPGLQFSEHYNQINEDVRIIYGFDERVSYDLLYKLNDKYFAAGITLVRYNDYCYILYLSSIISGFSHSGDAIQLSGQGEFNYKYKEKTDK